MIFCCLFSELSKKKRFHAPSILDPGHCSTAGERTLEEFNKLTNQQLEVQDLRDCGLTIEEVNFKLQDVSFKNNFIDCSELVKNMLRQLLMI